MKTKDISLARKATARIRILLGMVVLSCLVCHADNWTWKEQTVDPDGGRFTSIAIDKEGNLQVVYAGNTGGFRWGYRAANDTHWYTIPIKPGTGFTGLAIDRQGNPHVCLAVQNDGILQYGSFEGAKWHFQPIDPGSGPAWFSCSVAVSASGVPHITWYLERGPANAYVAHDKYAVLKDGEWLAQAVDLDPQAGKWHSLALDKDGNPHVSFDSFVNGALKYGTPLGSQWSSKAVDTRKMSGSYNVGMGNSLVLDAEGFAHISYETNSEIRYAEQTPDGFKVQTVVPAAPLMSWMGQRTSLVLDSQGHPHIFYDEAGSLKHAFWNGQRWEVQMLAASQSIRSLFRFPAAAIYADDTIYLSYTDPGDDSIKVMVGTLQRPVSDKMASSSAETSK